MAAIALFARVSRGTTRSSDRQLDGRREVAFVASSAADLQFADTAAVVCLAVPRPLTAAAVVASSRLFADRLRRRLGDGVDGEEAEEKHEGRRRPIHHADWQEGGDLLWTRNVSC